MSKSEELRERLRRGLPLLYKLIGVIGVAVGATILDFRQSSFAKTFQKEIQRIHPELKLENLVFESKYSRSYMTFGVTLVDLPQSDLNKYRENLENDIRQTFCIELKKSSENLKFKLFNVNVRKNTSESREYILASSISPNSCS